MTPQLKRDHAEHRRSDEERNSDDGFGCLLEQRNHYTDEAHADHEDGDVRQEFSPQDLEARRVENLVSFGERETVTGHHLVDYFALSSDLHRHDAPPISALWQ
ncbi:MAG: hypothetical protein ACO3V4_06470 [Ilumatobacteraceae bacterium]